MTPDIADAKTIIAFTKYPLQQRIADLETIINFQKAEIERLEETVRWLAVKEAHKA